MEPILVIPICLFIFYWISSSFFDSVAYADYCYTGLAVMIVAITGYPKHNEFIRAHYPAYVYSIIIVFNHALLVFPFIALLIYKGFYLHSLVVLVCAMFFSFIKKANSFIFVVPTPFGSKPYEFVVGFRRSFWVFFISYSLTMIAINVGNFNLGMFSILSIFFICSGYYMKPDPEFYIWVHTMTPKKFLRHKIGIALRFSLWLTLPCFILMSIFYFDQMHIVLFFEILGIVYVVLHILIRYSFLNHGGAFFQAITGVLSVLFPPILIIFLPYFYSKSIRNLKSILDDKN